MSSARASGKPHDKIQIDLHGAEYTESVPRAQPKCEDEVLSQCASSNGLKLVLQKDRMMFKVLAKWTLAKLDFWMSWELRGMLMQTYWDVVIMQNSAQKTELPFSRASFDERLQLTKDRIRLQEALTDPTQTVRAPLKITHSIALSLYLGLFFSPLLLSQLLTC